MTLLCIEAFGFQQLIPQVLFRFYVRSRTSDYALGAIMSPSWSWRMDGPNGPPLQSRERSLVLSTTSLCLYSNMDSHAPRTASMAVMRYCLAYLGCWKKKTKEMRVPSPSAAGMTWCLCVELVRSGMK